MFATNKDIRQRACTMDVTDTIKNSFNNQTKGGSAHVGKVVTIDSDNKVDIIATNEEVFGRLDTVYDDGKATVTDEGFVDLPTDGTSITYGQGLVGGSTAGTVKTGTSATVRAIASAGANMVRAKLL